MNARIAHRLSELASLAACGLLALAPARAGAQQAEQLDRLDARARVQVYAMRDSASAAGLPTEALLDLARQGVLKGGDASRVVESVRALYVQLPVARVALGGAATTGELESGAKALKAGAERGALVRLRTERPNKGSLEVPLVVLLSLVDMGTPMAKAADLVTQLARRQLTDAEFVRFQNNVNGAIMRLPSAAATVDLDALAAEALGVRNQNKGPGRPPPPRD